MLSPVGNFGKFLTVMLSLSVTGNIASTLYSICFNFQVMIPALSRVPRYIFSIVGTAMFVPHSLSFLSSADLQFLPIAHCLSQLWELTRSIRHSPTSFRSLVTGRVRMVPFSLLSTTASGEVTLAPMTTPYGITEGVCPGEQLPPQLASYLSV